MKGSREKKKKRGMNHRKKTGKGQGIRLAGDM